MSPVELLSRPVLGNPAYAYLLAAGVFAAAVAGLLAARSLLLARLMALASRTETDLDDFLVELLGKVKNPELYLLAGFLAARSLDLPGRADRLFHGAVVVAIAYRVVTLLQASVSYGVRKAMADGDPARDQAAKTVSALCAGLIWAGAAVFVLDNLGYNVSSMVAGLGIGGIAVALAAQAVLGDLFSALAIFLDRPFQVGEFIVTEGITGTVEQIGIKTTRVRALSGELLVAPNSKLTSSTIRNFRHLGERRVVFRFGLLYSTPAEQLRAVPGAVRAVVERDALLRFDRAHFVGFGDSSLDFEAVYYVRDPDYNRYMDAHQRVLLGVVDEVRARGLDFAFPTRTVILEGGAPPAKPA